VDADSHVAHRTARLVGSSQDDYFKLGLQLQGHSLLVQDQREAPLRPGDFAIYDTTRPYTFAFHGPCRMLVLIFPRPLLMLPAGEVSRLTATPLSDAELTPGEIAAAQHISTRYLHKLFSAEGTTVSAWIRQRRLENCSHDLRDPALAARSVSAIAARWGLPDASHFSRLFRAAFGTSPTEYRILHGGVGLPAR
jgi:AraC-like DNA-binding protein